MASPHAVSSKEIVEIEPNQNNDGSKEERSLAGVLPMSSDLDKGDGSHCYVRRAFLLGEAGHNRTEWLRTGSRHSRESSW